MLDKCGAKEFVAHVFSINNELKLSKIMDAKV
jgi:hypothetical protein